MTDFVFLHGGGQGSWVWDETLAAMRVQAPNEQHRLIALDVPGCGTKRGRDTGSIGFDAVIAELADDLRRAELSDAVLVGHSQAGTVLPRLIEAAPQLFRRAVYVSCIAPDPDATILEMTAQRLHGADNTPGGRAFNDPDMSQAERSRLMFCNDMAPAEQDAFLAKLGADNWPWSAYEHTGWRYDHLGAVPATYVVCLRDGILPVSWQHRFAERFRCGSLVSIDAGHQVMNTRPHALAEALLAEAAI